MSALVRTPVINGILEQGIPIVLLPSGSAFLANFAAPWFSMSSFGESRKAYDNVHTSHANYEEDETIVF